MTQTDTQLITRTARDTDFAVIAEMVRALAAHHGDTAAVSPEALRRDACDWYHMIVAEAGPPIVGYAALLPTGQLQFGVRGIDLHHLYVSEDWRGRGVGTALIDATVAHARRLGCAYITVGTEPDNAAAQSVYLARGFEPRTGSGARFRLLVSSEP